MFYPKPVRKRKTPGGSRGDPVTPQTARFVMLRDQWEMWIHSEDRIHHGVAYGRWMTTERVICIAPVLDPLQSGHCWGRTTLEHVKDDLRAGRRAKSDSAHLVSLCQGHTEDGRKAGFQWNTVSGNREKVRAYLRRFDEAL